MGKGPQPGCGVGAPTQAQIIEAYKALRSFAAIALPADTTAELTVASTGIAGAPYNIVHLSAATEGGEVRGSAFTANTDGTITANKNMFACSCTVTLVGLTASNDNIVVGIGIGDPTQIPTLPGVQVGENYVSRFRCASQGLGPNDELTWHLSVQPVGKSTTELSVNGVKAGDKLFPVVWTREADNAILSIRELIFTVEEISV